jgi:hypothetical protein
MSSRNRLALAAVALMLGACAPAVQQSAGQHTNPQASVAVRNDNWLDITVYLVRGAQRVRLGSVPSMSNAEFRIPQQYVLGVSDVTFQADPIGSHETYTSPPIQVYEGARVQLKIENQMRLSSFAVYPTQ